MKSYYEKCIKMAEEKFRLCKIGYVSEMKTIGEDLAKSISSDDISRAMAKIKIMNDAIGELEQSIGFAQQNLQDYLEKEEAKK